MNGHMVIDHFLDDFGWFRTICDQFQYVDEVNPADSVTYPGICKTLPIGIVGEAVYKLERATGGKVAALTSFLRLSLDSVKPPHSAHSDEAMGNTAMMVYLNRPEQCAGGTSFIRHKASGMASRPANEDEQALWERDTNKREAWEVLNTVAMQSNRAVIFDANLMHRAESPASFGTNPKDGRLVLACFAEVV